MTDSTFGFDAAFEPRLAFDFEHPNLPVLPAGDAGRAFFAVPNPGLALYGPIGDCARFAQMLLNRGRYGEVDLLRPGTVEAMIRNQIPGIGADVWATGLHDEASWGYGLDVTCVDRWRWFDGNLKPDGCFGHSGAGGTFFWADPDNDLVALYFSTCLNIDPETIEHHWNIDLFQNLVTAAVAD
jgi:CubicO group peptidase (beta-lactamase class C family)